MEITRICKTCGKNAECQKDETKLPITIIIPAASDKPAAVLISTFLFETDIFFQYYFSNFVY